MREDDAAASFDAHFDLLIGALTAVFRIEF